MKILSSSIFYLLLLFCISAYGSNICTKFLEKKIKNLSSEEVKLINEAFSLMQDFYQREGVEINETTRNHLSNFLTIVAKDLRFKNLNISALDFTITDDYYFVLQDGSNKVVNLYIGAIEQIERKTPYGDYYTENIKVSPNSIYYKKRQTLLNKSLATYINQYESDVLSNRNIEEGLGWRIKDGKLKRASMDEQTVAFWRGMTLESEAEVMKIIEEGIYAQSLRGKEGNLINEITSFLNKSESDKESWLRSQTMIRTGGSSDSFLIGGTATESNSWGNYRFEMEVPEHALYYDSYITRPFKGENEVFIPFFIMPEWIKKVVKRDTGQVVYEASSGLNK